MRFGWIRLHFLLVYAVAGAYLPYLPVYLGGDLGLPDAQIGWVSGVYGLSVLVAPPLFTSLADRSLSGRTIVVLASILTCASLVGLALADSFLAVLPFAFAFSLFYTPLFSLLDGLAFSAIAAAEQSGSAKPPPYQHLRVWGSLGFMLPAFVLFFALSRSIADGRAAILAAAISAGIAAIAGIFLPSFPPVTREPGLSSFSAWRALRGASTRALLAALGLLFAAISIFYAFYGRLLVAVGIDPAWVGFTVNLGVLAEIPLVFAAGALLRRWSVRALLLFGAASLTLRMVLLASDDPIVVVASQILHGPAVLALYLLPPMILNHKAEPALRNGVQGLYAMLCFGVARLLGSVAGGYAAEIELRWAFALGAVFSVAATAVLVLGFHDPEVDIALRTSNRPLV